MAISQRKAFGKLIAGLPAGACDNKIGNANVDTTTPATKKTAMSRDLFVSPSKLSYPSPRKKRSGSGVRP